MRAFLVTRIPWWITIIVLFVAFVSLASETGKTEFDRARRLFLDGKTEEAKPLFERAVELSGRRPSAVRALAQCERSLGNRSRAIALFEEYLGSNPDDAAAVRQTIQELKAEEAAERALAKPLDEAPREPAAEGMLDPIAPEPPPPLVDSIVPAPEPEGRFPWLLVAVGAVAVGSAVALTIALTSAGAIEPSGGTLDRVLYR
ncbi:MAG: tetratricopeptide repeat protein [Deltaproteobacteria bacterium]|nr:tetratricopeptide repeat protein [Deltaproteobacteria bacterium]